MGLEEIFRRRKSRIYPIQRDAQGLSLRQRCFDRFEKGQRPANVAKELGAKNPTVFRYFTDWRRLGPNFDKQLAYVKELFKKTAPDREKNIELFVKMLGIDKDKFEAILEKPYGLKQFLAKSGDYIISPFKPMKAPCIKGLKKYSSFIIFIY